MLNVRLWRNGHFVRSFVGATLSVIGSWFNTVTIAVLAYHIAGQVSLVAVVIAASVLPRVVLGPISGAIADHFERRNLLVTVDGVSAVAALLPLLVHTSSTLWLLYVSVALLQTCASLYNPAQRAYLPHVVPDDLLDEANGAFATMRDLGMFAGPALAAVVLERVGTGIAFWSNSLSFAVSAMLLLTLPRAAHNSIQTVNIGALFTGYVEIIRRYPRIAALYPCYMAAVAPIFLFQGVMVAFAKNLGQPSTFIGVLYAAAGIGGAIGGVTMGHYLRHISHSTAISIFVLSVPLLGAVALATNVVVALLLLACSVGAGTAGDVLFMSIVQRDVAPQERGRAFGLYFWSIAIGQLIGAGLGVALASVAVPALLWTSMLVLPIVMVSVVVSARSSAMYGRTVTSRGDIVR